MSSFVTIKYIISLSNVFLCHSPNVFLCHHKMSSYVTVKIYFFVTVYFQIYIVSIGNAIVSATSSVAPQLHLAAPWRPRHRAGQVHCWGGTPLSTSCPLSWGQSVTKVIWQTHFTYLGWISHQGDKPTWTHLVEVNIYQRMQALAWPLSYLYNIFGKLVRCIWLAMCENIFCIFLWNANWRSYMVPLFISDTY